MRSALSRGDSERAAALARAVTHLARTAVEDVRRLVSGLRPPVLDDLGLLGALRSTGLAALEHCPEVRIVTHGDLGDLPAAVEVAAYRIISEAMTNASHVPSRRSPRVAVSTGRGSRAGCGPS